MMHWLANLGINKKLIIYFSLLISLGVITYGIIAVANMQLRTSGGSIELARRNQNLALQMGFLANNVAQGDASAKTELVHSISQFERNLKLLKTGGEFKVREEAVHLKPAPEAVAPQLKQVETRWATYKLALNDLLTTNSDKEPLVFERAQKLITTETSPLYTATLNFGDMYVARYVDDYSFLQLIILFLFAINLVVLTLGIWMFRYFIAQPLAILIETLRGVNEGNLNFSLNFLYQDEVGMLGNQLNNLKLHIEESTDFANKVGEGKFDSEFQAKGEGDKLALALLNMRDNLMRVAEDDRRRNWANEGMAKFSDLLRQQYTTVEAMADVLLSNLVKYIGGSQGSFFQLGNEDTGSNSNELIQIACYAYNRKKFLKQTVLVGEGLVGQAVLERDTLFLTDIPETYVKIKSGLGQANPRNILVVPLMVNDVVYGVLELASFKPFEEHQVQFVKELSESIASTLANTQNGDKTRKLLEKSQHMTRIMQEQEEEMRQNMEEMQATQEEMDRKNRELASNDHRFTQLSSSVEGMLYQYVRRTDGSTGFAFASTGALQLLGYTPHEIVTAEDSSTVFRITDDDAASFYETFGHSMENMSEFQWEGRILDRTGTRRWLHMRSKPERLPNGEVMWSGLAYDISEQKSREETIMDMMNSMSDTQDELQTVAKELATVQEQLKEKQKEADALYTEIQSLRKDDVDASAKKAPKQAPADN